jgi:hypothetical protein
MFIVCLGDKQGGCAQPACLQHQIVLSHATFSELEDHGHTKRVARRAPQTI